VKRQAKKNKSIQIKERKTMKHLVYEVILVFIIGLGGCGKTDKTDVTVKTDDKTKDVDVKTKDATVSTGKLPDNYPSDIPQYKDAKILASASTAQGTTVTFEIPDKLKAVADFYKDAMKKGGYDADKNNDMMMTDKGGIMTYKKGGKDFTLTMGYDDARSVTSLVLVYK